MVCRPCISEASRMCHKIEGCGALPQVYKNKHRNMNFKNNPIFLVHNKVWVALLNLYCREDTMKLSLFCSKWIHVWPAEKKERIGEIWPAPRWLWVPEKGKELHLCSPRSVSGVTETSLETWVHLGKLQSRQTQLWFDFQIVSPSGDCEPPYYAPASPTFQSNRTAIAREGMERNVLQGGTFRGCTSQEDERLI